MAVTLLMTTVISANAQLYEYLETPGNVAYLGTPYAEAIVPGEFAEDPVTTYVGYAWSTIDTKISTGEPGTSDYDDTAHYWNWPGNVSEARPDGIYSLEILWDTAYDLTTLNAYVCSGDTIGTGGAIDADRVVSSVDFYVSYEPVGVDPVYTLVGSATPGATDDVGGFDLTSVSGTWNSVTSVRYDFTQPTVDTSQAPRIAEVQAIAPAVTVDYSPVFLNGLTLVGEGGNDNSDNLASGATAFSTPHLYDSDSTSGEPADKWQAANVNDGAYGSSGTNWIGLSASPTLGKGFVGLDLGETAQEIGFIAFSDNNVSGGDGLRCWGEYEVQYTTVANPDENTPDSAWTTIGTVDYARAAHDGDVGFENFQEPGKRHIYSFDSVMATGIRLVVPEVWEDNAYDSTRFPNIGWSETATAIDELEAYGPGKVFGAVPPTLEGWAYNADGVTITEEGGSYTAENLAMAAGAVAFGSSEYGASGKHLIANVNDGLYGNAHSWLCSFKDTSSPDYPDGEGAFIGIALEEETSVGSIAFGRNNSETLDYYLDRWAGTYVLQYTTAENPDETTTEWNDIGTLEYLLNLEAMGLTDAEGMEFYRPYKRHVIEFDPVTATGLRILITSVTDTPIVIDEFEIYAATNPQIPGDANNDGKVDGSDVTILAGNWQKGVSDGLTANWSEGDFNGDGKVDGSDVTILAGNWQYGVDASAASVPEPSTLALIFLLTFAYLMNRSKTGN